MPKTNPQPSHPLPSESNCKMPTNNMLPSHHNWVNLKVFVQERQQRTHYFLALCRVSFKVFSRRKSTKNTTLHPALSESEGFRLRTPSKQQTKKNTFSPSAGWTWKCSVAERHHTQHFLTKLWQNPKISSEEHQQTPFHVKIQS